MGVREGGGKWILEGERTLSSKSVADAVVAAMSMCVSYLTRARALFLLVKRG